MASKRRRRSRRRAGFIAIPYDHGLTLAALADGVVLSTAILTFGEDIWLMSADWVATIIDATAGEKPIEIGFAHGDLSVTEISEALGAEVTDPDDIIAKERSRRPVRKLGHFHHGSEIDSSIANGMMQRRKIGFSVGDGHSLNLYAVNRTGAALAGGSLVRISGTLYGRWQR